MLTEASGPRSAYSGRGHSFSLYGPTISTSRGEPEAKQRRAFFIKKIYENFGKSLAIFSETFGNLRKQFESVFHRFYDFLKFRKIFRNLWKCSEIFGNFRKTSETVQK